MYERGNGDTLRLSASPRLHLRAVAAIRASTEWKLSGSEKTDFPRGVITLKLGTDAFLRGLYAIHELFFPVSLLF